MYCSACGKKCPDGAVFCAWCGERLPVLEPGEALPGAVTAPRPAAEEAPEPAAGEAPEPPEEDPLDLDPDEEKEEPKQAPAPAHRLFQRPQPAFSRADAAQTVRPLSANPAQPLRGEEAVRATSETAEELQPDGPDGPDLMDDEAPAPRAGRKPAPEPEDDEWVRPRKDRQARAHEDDPPARRLRFGREGVQPSKPSPWEPEEERSLKHSPYEPEERPAKHSPYEPEERPLKHSPYEREPAKRAPYEQDAPPARRSPYEREDKPAKHSPYERQGEPPAKRAIGPDDDLPARPRDRADRPKPARGDRGKAVTASGGMVTPPARRSPARPSGPLKPPGKPKGDLFFEDLEMPAENFYDEAVEERALARRVRAIVTAALLVGVAMVLIWLMWTPGGQIIRAQLNLGAPASAYKALGDQDRAGGQIQRAADAYHNALKLDPTNYDYALLAGQTQEMVGDREKAIAAYRLCVKLKPAEAQPYRLLVDLYRVMGDSEAAEGWRAEGYKQTADASLAPGT